MALIACPECGTQVSDQAPSCISCGFPIASSKPPSQPRLLDGHAEYGRQEGNASAPVQVYVAKSRGLYIVLGLFLGFFGIHNFYAGRTGTAVAQLLVTVVLGWFVVGLVIVAIWVIFELFTVNTDGKGRSFD